MVKGRVSRCRYSPGLVPKRGDRRIVAGAIFGVLFVLLFVIVAVAQGIGNPSVPSGNVALVQDAPNSDITTDEFNAALKQTALGQGITKVPKPSDPQYATLKDAAMSNLITERWVAGEAADRGITASDTDIQNYIKQNIGGPSAFKKAAKQAGFSRIAGEGPDPADHPRAEPAEGRRGRHAAERPPGDGPELLRRQQGPVHHSPRPGTCARS